MRLDVWLDVACLFKTRSEAKKACEGGKIDLNGQAAKPHRDIKPGDEIEISPPASAGGRRSSCAASPSSTSRRPRRGCSTRT